MLELTGELPSQFYGRYILIAILACGALILWRVLRARRGGDAVPHDQASPEMEKKRTAARLAGTMQYLAYPIVFVPALVMTGDFGTAFLLAVVVGAAFMLWSRVLRGRYNRDFKENVVFAELAKTFDNLDYRPEARLDDRHIRENRFFNSQERMHGNDLIEADYRGKHFAQCDLVVEERVSRKGKSSNQDVWREAFRGRMMRFDPAKAFPGPVQVVKWNFEAAGRAPASEGWRAVETELHAFNESFKVFAKDPADAMTVLTPQMLEGVFRLDRLLNRPLGMLFADQSIYVFFPSGRDAFDVAATSGKTLSEERELLRQDIDTVTGFLDAMEYGMRDNRGLMDRLRPASEPPGDAEAAAPAPPGEPSIPEDASPGIGGYAFKRNLLWLWRTPGLLALAGYLASAVYVFRKFPDRFGVGVHIVNDDVTLTRFVPTTAYLIVLGLFVTLAALSIKRGPWTHNLAKAAVLAALLAVHAMFLHYNLVAQ